MKIEIKINNKNFKDTWAFTILYTLLCVVRVVLVVTICWLPMLISIPIFNLLGLKKVFSKWTELFDYLAFNKK